MGYCFSKIVDLNFEDAVEKTIELLKDEGFGVITDIDLKAKMKEKLDVDINKYRILGVCNPPYAYEALQIEDNIGVMLPCNVIVRDLENGSSEVAAIEPVATMKVVENPVLEKIAEKIQVKLQAVINIL